jgi:uncharacterized membrane protein
MRTMSLLDYVTVGAALGCAIFGGIMFAFSTFVMKALGSLPPAHGIAAMQTINVVIINPWFMVPFLGTVVTCAVLIGAAFLRWHEPGAAYWLSGGLLYIVGAFLVTMVFNVPRNNALMAITPSSEEGARLWATYLSEWTAWNHVRTVAALAAVVLFMLALRARA